MIVVSREPITGGHRWIMDGLRVVYCDAGQTPQHAACVPLNRFRRQ